MPRTSPYTIELTDEERRTLEARARKYTLPYREVVRALFSRFRWVIKMQRTVRSTRVRAADYRIKPDLFSTRSASEAIECSTIT